MQLQILNVYHTQMQILNVYHTAHLRRWSSDMNVRSFRSGKPSWSFDRPGQIFACNSCPDRASRVKE